jgi:hypothetical protein
MTKRYLAICPGPLGGCLWLPTAAEPSKFRPWVPVQTDWKVRTGTIFDTYCILNAAFINQNISCGYSHLNHDHHHHHHHHLHRLGFGTLLQPCRSYYGHSKYPNLVTWYMISHTHLVISPGVLLHFYIWMHYYVINPGVMAFSLRTQTLIQLFMTVNLNIIGKPLNLNKLQASLCYSIINYRLEKMLKETCCTIHAIIQEFIWKDWWEQRKRIRTNAVPAKIQTRHLPNTSL